MPTKFALRQIQELRAVEGITVYESSVTFLGGLRVKARIDGEWRIMTIRHRPVVDQWDI
jgi:hypothetical protein